METNPADLERAAAEAQRARMRQLAEAYAAGLPGRDTHSLVAGLGSRLVFMQMGHRDGAYDPEHDVILINSDARPERQRFTLAHEISHALLLGDDDLLSELHDGYEGERLEARIETLCNVGAAAILLPPALVQEVREKFGSTGRALYELARRADVSASVALYELAEQTPEPVIFAVCARPPGKAGQKPGAPLLVRASAQTASGRYSLRPGTVIPTDHPVAVALDTGLEHEERSYVPFRSGRKVPAWVSAYPALRRVMVGFRLEG